MDRSEVPRFARNDGIWFGRMEGLVRKSLVVREILFVVVGVLMACAGSLVRAQAVPAPAGTNAQTVGNAIQASAPPVQQERITKYTLSPERDAKARALAKVRLRTIIVNLVYGFVVLLAILWWKVSAKYRDVAEKTSAKRFVQVLVFTPLIALTMDVLELPTGIYDNWLGREYGLSVQGWGSWFWDWAKGELLSVIFSIIVVAILYWAIRKWPRGWWFAFWLATIPLVLALVFIQPLVIDPMFHKFESLQVKDPALTAELEKLVQRAGENIPPERMYWMGAGEKTTELNAYVTGFGASKRIVVWDTTIAKMNTPQIVYVAGHEMGHYVLKHIPKGLAFGFAGLFVLFYLGYRLVGWVLARWGAAWGIREVGDLASYPALLLVLSILSVIGGPVGNTFSRYEEHQADQYGLEVTHGLTPDSGQVAAQSFNILGDVDLSAPEPSRLRIFLFYSHPAIPDRILFALGYDPWRSGGNGEFVK
jgi:STE24 endopeptidase